MQSLWGGPSQWRKEALVEASRSAASARWLRASVSGRRSRPTSWREPWRHRRSRKLASRQPIQDRRGGGLNPHAEAAAVLVGRYEAKPTAEGPCALTFWPGGTGSRSRTTCMNGMRFALSSRPRPPCLARRRVGPQMLCAATTDDATSVHRATGSKQQTLQCTTWRTGSRLS